MIRDAIIDATGQYRYSLCRCWEPTLPGVCWVMLNPSTADATQDDPTIRRCISFARGWGYGSLEVVNLFAYRAPLPADLRCARDPVGPENDQYLVGASARADLVIAAWGANGGLLSRDRKALPLLGSLHCLGTTRSGFPRHPLYRRADADLVPYQGRSTNYVVLKRGETGTEAGRMEEENPLYTK